MPFHGFSAKELQSFGVIKGIRKMFGKKDTTMQRGTTLHRPRRCHALCQRTYWAIEGLQLAMMQRHADRKRDNLSGNGTRISRTGYLYIWLNWPLNLAPLGTAFCSLRNHARQEAPSPNSACLAVSMGQVRPKIPEAVLGLLRSPLSLPLPG